MAEKKQSEAPPRVRQHRNPARTAANKLRRIARNAAQKSGKLPKHKRARSRRRAEKQSTFARQYMDL